MKRVVWLCVVIACKGTPDPAAKKGGRGGGSGSKLEYPVDVLKLEAKQVQYTVEAPGSIDAVQPVQITARVAGAVDKVGFAEGQSVKKNDVLVTIESERYQIALE